MDMDAYRQLKELYAQVPKMKDCKRLCQASCVSALDMSRLERELLEARGIQFPPYVGSALRFLCPALNQQGACTARRARPTICRLWGASKIPTLRCPHGCEPERWLSPEEVMELLFRSYEIGGHKVTDGLSAAEMMRRAKSDPNVWAEVLAYFMGGEQVGDDPQVEQILQNHYAGRPAQLHHCDDELLGEIRRARR